MCTVGSNFHKFPDYPCTFFHPCYAVFFPFKLELDELFAFIGFDVSACNCEIAAVYHLLLSCDHGPWDSLILCLQGGFGDVVTDVERDRMDIYGACAGVPASVPAQSLRWGWGARG